MGVIERFQLLFAQDDAIFQLDARLRHPHPAGSSAAPLLFDKAPDLLKRSSTQLANLSISTAKDDDSAAIRDPGIPSPHDGTFCPILAMSRFPYHHIHGDLMQKVASGFFDKGQFWHRKWDLYYIHVPHRLGGRPLLLVPMSQVRALLRQINKALDCSLHLPTEEHRGLVLNFNREGFPQPKFLGQSHNRNMKDRLEATIPQKVNIRDSSQDSDKEMIAFEKMVEAAVSSAKYKSESKAKKQRLRIQRKLDNGDAVRRSLCYLGLLADSIDQIDNKWYEQPESEQPRFDVNKLVPYPFWTEAVFISVDVEVHERSHSQVTEIGISTLDTRDLIGVAPGTNGEEWQSRIQSRHLRVKEYENHANHLYVRGCPANFEFGTSEWVASNDLSNTVQACFALPSFFNGADKKLRPLVLVGHNLDSDIQYLKLANVHVQGNSGISQFVDRIDIAASFQLLRGETNPRSLGAVIEELGMTGWYLHNAGNDARYTLQALVAMLINHSVGGLTGGLKPGEAPHVCVEMGD
ncbi:hypothetical protein BDW72DRAFT_189121 [Aspergillus terricola var. indicus]